MSVLLDATSCPVTPGPRLLGCAGAFPRRAPFIPLEQRSWPRRVVGPARVLHVRVPPGLGGLLRPLQHRIHLREVDVAEQRRDDPSHAIDNPGRDGHREQGSNA